MTVDVSDLSPREQEIDAEIREKCETRSPARRGASRVAPPKKKAAPPKETPASASPPSPPPDRGRPTESFNPNLLAHRERAYKMALQALNQEMKELEVQREQLEEAISVMELFVYG